MRARIGNRDVRLEWSPPSAVLDGATSWFVSFVRFRQLGYVYFCFLGVELYWMPRTMPDA